MASLRAKIAELERRMLALEARQIAWRADAASKAGSPDSGPDHVNDLMKASHGMMDAIKELRAECDKLGKRPEQIQVFVERGIVFARAYFEDLANDVDVSFEQPWGFRCRDAKKLFEEALHVE
jgi:hypothetical protein